MKRYLLFAGDKYYAGGGWSDFKGDFHFCTEAMAALQAIVDPKPEWWHVVDCERGRIASRSYTSAHSGNIMHLCDDDTLVVRGSDDL